MTAAQALRKSCVDAAKDLRRSSASCTSAPQELHGNCMGMTCQWKGNFKKAAKHLRKTYTSCTNATKKLHESYTATHKSYEGCVGPARVQHDNCPKSACELLDSCARATRELQEGCTSIACTLLRCRAGEPCLLRGGDTQ